MKYSVEFNNQNGVFTETLEIDGYVAQKKWKRQSNSAISGLCTSDRDFSEQLKEMFDEDQCNSIHEFFDDLMLVADMEDFIMIERLE